MQSLSPGVLVCFGACCKLGKQLPGSEVMAGEDVVDAVSHVLFTPCALTVCFWGLVLGSFSVFGFGSGLGYVCVRLESSWKDMVRKGKWREVSGRRGA